jgi:hypothetical protein
MKQWNVVAGLAIFLTFVYAIGCLLGLWLDLGDKLEMFKQAMLPLVTAVYGYLAAMLKSAANPSSS